MKKLHYFYTYNDCLLVFKTRFVHFEGQLMFTIVDRNLFQIKTLLMYKHKFTVPIVFYENTQFIAVL